MNVWKEAQMSLESFYKGRNIIMKGITMYIV